MQMADLQMFFRGFVTWYIKPSFMTKEKIEQKKDHTKTIIVIVLMVVLLIIRLVLRANR